MVDGKIIRDREQAAQAALDAHSPRMFRVFMAYLDRYFARNFDAVRVLGEVDLELPDDRSIIFYCSHTAWWDPILALFLSSKFTPGRRAFGPMDAAALKKYGFMKRVGMFAVEQNSTRGAAQFLRTAKAILNAPDTAIWMTPQGAFFDVRERPIIFKPGLAHLARDTSVLLVAVAFEYPFWEEAKPEVLVHFGKLIDTAASPKRSADAWNRLLEKALEATMDELSEAAKSREASKFTAIVSGRARVNPIYDGWRYLKAMLRGEKFSAAHKDR